MANSSVCLQQGCEEQPRVNVIVVYPPDALKPDGKESCVSFCLDHVGMRVESMLKTGNALTVAIQRLQ